VVALAGQGSIADAYNKILRAVASRMARGDALVLVHDDLEIVDPDAERVILDAVQRFHVSGPVGTAGEFGGIAWWNGGLQGRQVTDSGPVGVAPYLGPAVALDGSCLILSATVAKALRFDEGYDGWHAYDVDLCRMARRWCPGGDAVGTVPLATHHHTTLGFKSQEIGEAWARADERYRAKWERT
jgi:hypothetical protein